MQRFCTVKELKPNVNSVQYRLPLIYKKYLESLKVLPSPVHYIPHPKLFILDPVTKEKRRVENRDIPLKFPKEADEGIWGGEGVIQGFTKEVRNKRKYPHFWIPALKKAVIYSEILNQYLNITLTERTLRLIDEKYGFDHYILSTPVQDLKSQLALSIRRKMYFTLLDLERHPKDEKTNEVFEKYKKYMISKEEAEWFGLTLREAVQKQRLLEEEQQPVPLKHALRVKYIEDFKMKSSLSSELQEELSDHVEESSYKSWLNKLNPFQSKKKSED